MQVNRALLKSPELLLGVTVHEPSHRPTRSAAECSPACTPRGWLSSEQSARSVTAGGPCSGCPIRRSAQRDGMTTPRAVRADEGDRNWVANARSWLIAAFRAACVADQLTDDQARIYRRRTALAS